MIIAQFLNSKTEISPNSKSSLKMRNVQEIFENEKRVTMVTIEKLLILLKEHG
jgi:hypothetical protein